MVLPRQLLGMPSAGDTLESITKSALEVVSGKVNFVSNRPTIELDLHDVALILPEPDEEILQYHQACCPHPDEDPQAKVCILSQMKK